MKKIAYIALLIYASNLNAQENNTSDFQLDDKGLNFTFNEGAYEFNINGFIQPSVSIEKTKNQDSNNTFNARRTFFMIGGKAMQEKVSFLLQTDFSLSQPLLDAWIAYHPYEWLTLTGGQKQSFLNNREMIYREDKLQFTDRNRLSKLYSKTGREFGLFIETKFGKNFGIAPKLAITSGDGRNSFGSDSRDSDLGGVKIGGRLDIYPLGYFSKNNDLYTADLAHEETVKILIGGAVSKNKGVTNAVGEGHGDFIFYDNNGKNNLADYSQAFADLLLKYNGFSFLAEYANASASNINRTFIDQTATTILAPQQISEYLILGDTYSFQTGYVTKKGLSFDLRYENTAPEFKENSASLLPESNSYTLGITKYFKYNNIKIQGAVTNIDYSQGEQTIIAEFVFQIGF
ncbi:conserved exported hypothetical protein [Flavobacterium sp. 9AF]|uniref:hypothetical protein n=1 Tax=Flavobacterium sp. 9AF TaxID=2653142 RepID=UPI0012F24707|nr:hypothetical protein [Flavobacterium sp. 9AF]VXB05799.1 conserved exported hypothetical protein [Flavobacterium sp. 9AF]